MRHLCFTRALHKRIKNFITENTLPIQFKGKDILPDAPSYSRVVAFSNSENPFKIEESDRRMAVFEVPDTYINNTEYFDKVLEAIQCDAAIVKLYQFYATFDLTGLNVKKRPITQMYNELKVQQVPLEIAFLKHYLFEKHDDESLAERKSKVPANTLFYNFLNWIAVRKIAYVTNENKFGIKMAKFKIDGITKTISKNVQKYNFDFEKVASWMTSQGFMEADTEEPWIKIEFEFVNVNVNVKNVNNSILQVIIKLV